MSNPNFPGSSWQDRSEYPGGPSLPPEGSPGGNYNLSGNSGWAGADGATYPRDTGYGGAAGAGAAQSGRSGRRDRVDPGYAGDGYARGDNGSGYGGNGHAGRDYAGNGRTGNGYANGSYGNGGYGNSGNGYGQDLGGSSRGHGGLASAGPDLNPGSPGGDDIGRGHAKGYRGRAARGAEGASGGSRGRGAAKRAGRTDLAGPAGYYQPDGADGFYRPDQDGIYRPDPDDLYRPAPAPPGRAGGPGRRSGSGRGSGGGRGRGGGPQGLVGPQRNLLQRLWHGRWWRHWSIKKVLLLTGSLVAVLALLLVAGFAMIYNHYKVPLAAIASAQQQSSVVYFGDGHTQVGTFGQINRTILTTFPALLEQAFFAAEDRNFQTEGGISLTGTARALYVDLTGGSVQGGSTITEELIKNYYEQPGAPRTLSTKLAEIVVAIKLAKLESKSWILAHYLNTIFLGPKYIPGGAYGVQAAAEEYFGVPVTKLTMPQDAMLAAMVQAPSAFDPRHPHQNVSYLGYSLFNRWQYVLTNMVRDNAITQQQKDSATFPRVIKPRLSTWSGYKGYIMNLVLNELQADGYSNKTIYNGGLRIYTTISQRLMSGLYSAVRQNIAVMRQEGVKLPWYVHIGAVLEKPGTGQILAIYGGPGFGVKHCKKLKCQLDTVLAAEPVGSSFKPYVLATAVSQGMDVQTSVMNSHAPLCIPPDWTLADRLMQSKQTLKCDTPNGFWPFTETSENYHQNLTVPEATAYSNDPAYEDLIHRTGVQPVIDMAAKLGVSSYDVAGLNALFGDGCTKLKHDLNCHPGAVIAALGAGSLSAVDQANTFATLIDGGTSVTPHVIRYVIQGTSQNPPKVTRTQALTPAQAADADYALSFDTTLPGATGLNASWNRPVIAKTGTLGTGANASQAWFIGAIPQYSLSVGMFTDRPQAVPPQILDVLPPVGGLGGGYGGAWPARIWHTFMTEQFNNLKILPLPAPNFSTPPFYKWVQAPKPKPKPKRCKNGRVMRRPGPCPSPTPTPSGTPTPTPTPTPSGTPSPTPTPSQGPPGPARQLGRPGVPAPKPAGLPSLTLATPPPLPLRRPGWVATTALG